jgi:hypothetical protein
VVIHTGFWGCGAFGGNRTLMALLQLLAARLSGIDRLVFHTHYKEGTDAFDAARQILDRDLLPAGSRPEVAALTRAVEAVGFQWGVSDGN